MPSDKSKVLIVGGQDPYIYNMFLKNGWEVTYNELDSDVDLIQFTGGADVDPSYYKEQKHPATFSDPKRDARESNLYHEFNGKLPMAGICRGGQFLNVMNGGQMWQHVNNHTGTHLAYDHLTETELPVTSTHHQMIIPTAKAVTLMTAKCSTSKQGFDIAVVGSKEDDIEAVFYEESKSLCYQPHPEYVEITHPCQKVYFNYLEHFFGLK